MAGAKTDSKMVNMNQNQNPNWWGPDNDFAWSHVKLAMRRDWNQSTQGKSGCLNRRQNALHAAGEMCGTEPILPLGQHSFEDVEPACRFGYGARLEYGLQYLKWNDELELHLVRDWRTLNPTRMKLWEQDYIAMRYGWNFDD